MIRAPRRRTRIWTPPAPFTPGAARPVSARRPARRRRRSRRWRRVWVCPSRPAHRAFLRWAGADHLGALRGSEWFLRDLPGNAALLPELLAENGLPVDAAAGAVCFFSHQGYMAGWYRAGGAAADPDCLLFAEGDAAPAIRPAGRFSAFLLKDLGGAAAG